MLSFHYSDTELKKIMETFVVLVDSREKENAHILSYFDGKKVPYEVTKLCTGDYSCKIPKNADMGIMRDLFLDTCVERKNSLDELAQSIKEDRFEAELIRSQKIGHFALLVEDSYENLVNGVYRSKYDSKALTARIKTFEARYGYGTTFLADKSLAGNWILYELWYRARNNLKKLA